MLIIAILAITILTCCLPVLVDRGQGVFPAWQPAPAPAWLAWLAGLLFFVAWFIPDIHISEATTTFQQHFLGGVYAACLYVYFKKLFKWRLHWLVALLGLFAWASMLGVANELLEFSLNQLQLANIDTSDTDWDLLANTLGALVGYVILVVCRVERLD